MAQLLFDFAGRGDSDGDVITLGEREADDVRAAVDVLVRRPEVDASRIGAVGKSMGAVAVILAAARDSRIRALVLDGPFADLADVVDGAIAARHLPAGLLRPLVFRVAGWRASFDPASLRPEVAMREVRAPVLLLHGEEDDLVPFEHALRLERAAGGPLTLIPLPGEGHNTARSEEILDRIATYLTATLGP
jgi:dipeptidyl aminopeptidase/acylaminoacyl peptidase